MSVKQLKESLHAWIDNKPMVKLTFVLAPPFPFCDRIFSKTDRAIIASRESNSRMLMNSMSRRRASGANAVALRGLPMAHS